MKYLMLVLSASMLFACASAQTLDEAKKLTENEQYESATETYKQLISKDPAAGNNFYFYGENLLLSQNPDSAQIIFENGKKADPTNPLIKIGFAKVLLNAISLPEAKDNSTKDPSNATLKKIFDDAKSNVEQAMKLIDEATGPAPIKDAQIAIEAADALIHYKNKNLDRAKSFLDRAFALDPKNADIQILFGDIYTELNNGTLAADYYNKAQDLNKNSAHAVVNKGRLYRRSTNLEGAAIEFENAIKIDPNYAPAYRELGEVYFKLGKTEKAKENYRKFLELSKNNCSARIQYAAILYSSKDFQGALNELNQIQQKCDPNNVRMLRIYSYCYFETKDYTKGIEMVNRLFSQLTPDKRISLDYEYYGKLLIANNQDSLGVIQLQQAYSMAPERTDLLYEIGYSFYKQKRYQEAIDAFNEKKKIGKDMKARDYMYLGQSYYFTSQFSLADSALAKLNELSPEYFLGWSYRADVNAQMDSTSEQGLAKPFYEKMIELGTKDSATVTKYKDKLILAYGYLASYYALIKKDNATSIIYLKKKLDLLPPDDPERKTIKIQIQQLEAPPKKN